MELIWLLNEKSIVSFGSYLTWYGLLQFLYIVMVGSGQIEPFYWTHQREGSVFFFPITGSEILLR